MMTKKPRGGYCFEVGVVLQAEPAGQTDSCGHYRARGADIGRGGKAGANEGNDKGVPVNVAVNEAGASPGSGGGSAGDGVLEVGKGKMPWGGGCQS